MLCAMNLILFPKYVLQVHCLKKKSIDRISFFKKKQVTVNTSECYKLLTTELPNLSCRFLRCNLCIILVKQTCATFAS